MLLAKIHSEISQAGTTVAYVGDLNSGQQVYLENQGTQTIITLASSGPGRQQSQSNGLETGSWLAPPTLFRTSMGLILRIEATQGQCFIQLQANGISVMETPPLLAGADVLPLRQTETGTASSQGSTEPMQPMQPIKPLEPMSPMKPMEMRMGNMEMRMGAPEQSLAGHRFCSQCGQAIEAGDRFCSHCGHRLVREG
jgi:hypothetical protein